MAYLGIHRCKSFRVDKHFADNGNSITLQVLSDEGRFDFTLYGLPDEVTTRLVESFADEKTYYPEGRVEEAA